MFINTYSLTKLVAKTKPVLKPIVREVINFDSKWKFHLGDTLGVEKQDFNDENWRVLNLPHDWSIEGEYNINNPMGPQCGYLPAGIGWYRKTIVVPKEWKDKHIEIAFDGVCMNSTVWANGKKLGFRPYGWSSFVYDISDIVSTSNSITFTVKVDNKKQPSARWYTGSGIYAHTWLYIKNKTHISYNGVFVRTKGNKVSIDTEIVNGALKKSQIEVKSIIIDDSENVIKFVKSKFKIIPGNKNSFKHQLLINKPILWSVENPYLYTLITEVRKKGKLVDSVVTRFGIRDVEWRPKTGMWLNGKNVKLQGVCNHQDAGALGAAVPDKVLRYRIQQLKKMGVNAIRTAHNPQTPIFYDICDELGILVMDEIFDGWKGKAANDYGKHAFSTWWQRDLVDWIKRDRNHPSVVIYSVGNETHGEVAKELIDTCHKYDDTRPVTSGHSGSKYMDVLGVNGASEKKGWFDNLPEDKVFIGTENTHTWQVRGYYRTKTWYRDGYPNNNQKPYKTPDLTKKEVFSHDWVKSENRKNQKQIFNSSYDNAMVRLNSRRSIEQLRDIPNYAGAFRWTGYDYIGEAGYVHGGWPFKSFMGGAIDIANFEKDLYYLYKSQWTNKPMVHLLPHWTHPKLEEGTEIPVWVYSNCDQIELILNGVSLGKKNPGTTWSEMQCQWMVPWKAGKLKAIGYKNGKVMTEKVVQTSNKPAHIALSVDGESLSNTINDIVQVRVTTTDEKQEFYPYGENRTYFHVIGSGKVRALDNGSPVDVEKHFEAKDRIAFYGLTRAYIESTDKNGAITLLATSILGEKKLLTTNEINIDAQLISLRGKMIKSNVKIYYTIDGTEPTIKSRLYKGAFKISIGVTVKALVVLNDNPIYRMQERFAQDEGFVWNNVEQEVKSKGSQAEEAKYQGANIETKMKNYRGKGYLSFTNLTNSFIEWYQENDGDTTEAELSIRYCIPNKEEKYSYLKLTINNKIVKKKIKLEKVLNQESNWQIIKIPIYITRGANTIRISPIINKSILIDEMHIH